MNPTNTKLLCLTGIGETSILTPSLAKNGAILDRIVQPSLSPLLIIVPLKLLNQKGYKVTKASNGHDAEILTKNNRFDLVLLDQTMPGIDGIETLNRIKKLNEWENGVILDYPPIKKT